MMQHLVDQKDDYYIASYSAHASVLENIVGKKGVLKMLLIDGGGLKAHHGTFGSKNGSLFTNYYPLTKKILHAKIVFLSGKKLLWLSTGNFRTTAVSQEENISIVKKLTPSQSSTVRKWFCHKKELTKNLIINVSEDKVKGIELSDKNMVQEFQDRIKAVHEDELSLHVFSPWGSSIVLQKILRSFSCNLKNIHVYSRETDEDELLWIDCDIDKLAQSVKRYTRKPRRSLPHFKCIFVTKKNSNSDEVIFAYIGSANLTKAAFIDKNNIEFGTFFTNIKRKESLNRLLRQLKRNSDWIDREPGIGNKKLIDESERAQIDEEDIDNFEIRRKKKQLLNILSVLSTQNELARHYEKNGDKPYRLRDKLLYISVSEIDETFLYVKVAKEDFELEVPNLLGKEFFSPDKANNIINSFLTAERISGKGNREVRIAQNANDSQQTSPAKKQDNIRFRITEFLENNELTKQKKRELKSIPEDVMRKYTSNNLKFSLWSQIIEAL